MADVKKVNQVNQELNAMIDVMKRNRENPSMIRIAELFAQLTDTGENEQEETKAAVASVPPEPEPEAEHVHQFNPYGRCVTCKFCLHQKVVEGTCLVCDEKVD